MALITIAALQRDFGLSFPTVSAVLNEHRVLASRPHHGLILAAIACNVVLLAAYVPGWQWPAMVMQWLLLVALLPGVLHLYRTQRDSRVPIRATARAWQPRSTNDFTSGRGDSRLFSYAN